MLVVVGLLIAIVTDTLQKHHDEAVAQANKKVEELVVEGEAAFSQGKLDDADKHAGEASSILIASNKTKAEDLKKKVVDKREQLKIAAAKALQEAAEKAKLEEERKESERLLAEEEAAERKKAKEKEEEAEELSKLTKEQQLAWILCEGLRYRLHLQIHEELKRMELEVKTANKEPDADRKRLALIRVRDEYQPKFAAVDEQLKKQRGFAICYKQLPPDFQRRYLAAFEKQLKEDLLAIATAFSGID